MDETAPHTTHAHADTGSIADGRGSGQGTGCSSTGLFADSPAAVLHVAVQHMHEVVVVDAGALRWRGLAAARAGGACTATWASGART